MIVTIIVMVASVLIGYGVGYSFAYWKEKLYGGKNMVIKNDVISDGEVKKGIINKIFPKKQPKAIEPVKAETKEAQPIAELPDIPESPEAPTPDIPNSKEEINISSTLESIISDLDKMSQHMDVMKNALIYLNGYMKGKNDI